MAVVVVDRLEVIDVEHHQRQRPIMSVTADDLPFQELGEIPAVVNLSQGIQNRQSVNLFVVFRLDVPAGEEPVNAVADSQIVSVTQGRVLFAVVIDEGSVGAAEIGDGVLAVGRAYDVRVVSRDGVVCIANGAILLPSDEHRDAVERIACAHVRPGRVDVDQTGRVVGGANRVSILLGAEGLGGVFGGGGSFGRRHGG